MTEIINWPIAAIIIIISIAFIFKKQFSNLLSGVKRLDIKGIKMYTQDSDTNILKSESNMEAIKSFDSQFIREKETEITQLLVNYKIYSDNEKISFLIRMAAEMNITLTFEKLYASIYGSQIRLLELLNTQSYGCENKEELKSFYDDAATRFPNVFDKYSYNDYLNFLIMNKVITDNNGLICITHIGKEFLMYLIKTGKTSLRYY